MVVTVHFILPSIRGGSCRCFPSTMSEIHFDFAYGRSLRVIRVDIPSSRGLLNQVGMPIIDVRVGTDSTASELYIIDC